MFIRLILSAVTLGLLITSIWMFGPHHAHYTWELTDISGHLPDLQFSLIKDDSQKVTAANYKGQVILLYFGYTSCPAECPMTLGYLSAVLKALGQDKKNVRILFVSVDSTHDTPALLHYYLQSFDQAHINGLTGTYDEIESIAKRYRIAFLPKDNSIPHSNVIYIFDAAGHARLLATADAASDKWIHDIEQLSHAD